jgi:hypothetical protein
MDSDIRKLPTIGGCGYAATILSGYRGTCTVLARCAACVLLTQSDYEQLQQRVMR